MNSVKSDLAAPSPLSASKRLAAAVYEEIKGRIITGAYAPGEWLSVEELSRVFSVSRQPVMDAMRRLSSDWLVEVVPQVGCRVANYDHRSVVDFLSTFGEVEGQVAALAAERRTSHQLTTLIGILEQIRTHDTMDADNVRLGRDFHSTVLEMSHSTVLTRLCEQLWDFGTFVARPPRQLQDVDFLRRRTEALHLLTEAIRQANPGMARLQIAVWLIGLGDLVTLSNSADQG